MNKEDLLMRLKTLLASLDKSDIFRSVYDHKGEILAVGVEPLKQKLTDDFCKVDFKGKTIIDLGSGFGFFSFLSARCGAKHITAVDCLPQIVEGGNILAELNGYRNVIFRNYNFEEPDEFLGTFDIAMLVDFFGKSSIRKKKIEAIVRFVETLSNQELLFAIRPINRIEKDIKMTVPQFSQLYPPEYIIDGSFYLLRYIKDMLADNWSIRAVSDFDGQFHKDKLLFLCQKR